ncbi:MAG: hypothetical protein L3J71_12645 [Victivallaceae bacterium]|nr:hypothetical protein [Victivallaceae bacterium]
MKKLLILIVALASVSVMASTARVDIDGRKAGIKLTPGSKTAGCALSNPGWIKPEEKSKQMLYFAVGKLKKDKWREVEFSFTPNKSGKVRLFIRAEWSNVKKGAKPYYVYFKELSIVGAKLKNSKFSEKDAKGKVINWGFNPNGKNPPVFKAENSETIVKLSHGDAMNQYIEVTKDKLVKIKIIVKSAMDNAK